MEKKTFIVKGAIWVAVVCVAILLILGLGWGYLLEGTLFAEVTKWFTVGVGVIAIIEGLYFCAIGPLIWHWKEKKGKK